MAWEDLVAIGVGVGTTVLTGNPAAGIGAGKATHSALGGGGGGGPVVCPGSYSPDVVARAMAAAPPARLQRLQQLHDAVNANKPFTTEPVELQLRAMGGTDCKHSSPGGQEFQAEFLAIVREFGGSPTWGTTPTAPPPQVSSPQSTGLPPVRVETGGGRTRVEVGKESLPWWMIAVAALAVGVLVMQFAGGRRGRR